jgi:hypothetical protein
MGVLKHQTSNISMGVLKHPCPGELDEVLVRFFTLPLGEKCPKYMRKGDL